MPPPTSPDTAGLRDFAAVMTERVQRAKARRTRFWLPTLAALAAGTGLGVLVSQPVALAVAAVVSAAALLTFWRMDPAARSRIDWATAETYRKELTADLDPQVRSMLKRAGQTVADNLKVPVTHLFQMPKNDHDGPCGRCACARFDIGAALWPSRTHPTLIIGARLLHDPGLLQMAVGHEARHSRPWLWRALILRRVGLIAGPFPLGLTVPLPWLPWAALAWLGAMIAWSWWDELVCDLAAARHPLADATGWYAATRMVLDADPHPWLAWLAMPLHPPLGLRAAIVTRLARSR